MTPEKATDTTQRNWLHFDNTVNTGHLLSGLVMITSAIAAVVLVQSDLRRGIGG